MIIEPNTVTILHFFDAEGCNAHVAAEAITSIRRLSASSGFDGTSHPERTQVFYRGGGGEAVIICCDDITSFRDNIDRWYAARAKAVS